MCMLCRFWERHYNKSTTLYLLYTPSHLVLYGEKPERKESTEYLNDNNDNNIAKWFESRSISYSSCVIVRVRVDFKKTVSFRV